LRLDLLARDAFVEGEPLGLHPREFGLLWRLSDKPGKPLSKRRLIEDVWHLRFVPETNSLAVHVLRLRAKLRLFDIADLLMTTSSGDYVLIESKAETHADPPAAMVKAG
jgi:DNA-binding response OmpR family regulator